jgi:hypothetical protein
LYFCQFQGDYGGTIIGRRKPVGNVQTSDRGEESAETQIHSGFQAAVGVAVEDVDSVVSGCAPHATCDGQKMAHPNVSLLLALEVKGASWPSSNTERDAGSDSPAKPRKPAVER